MKTKTVVTISRYWNNPQILTTVSNEEIALQIDLDNFISFLITEIGPITWVITDKQFKSKVETAVKSVIDKIKEESIKVM